MPMPIFFALLKEVIGARCRQITSSLFVIRLAHLWTRDKRMIAKSREVAKLWRKVIRSVYISRFKAENPHQSGMRHWKYTYGAICRPFDKITIPSHFYDNVINLLKEKIILLNCHKNVMKNIFVVKTHFHHIFQTY